MGINRLETMNISQEAKIRITEALTANKYVTVPERMVEIQGISTIAWFEFDKNSGELIGVTENGGHQTLAEYRQLNSNIALAEQRIIQLGRITKEQYNLLTRLRGLRLDWAKRLNLRPPPGPSPSLEQYLRTCLQSHEDRRLCPSGGQSDEVSQ